MVLGGYQYILCCPDTVNAHSSSLQEKERDHFYGAKNSGPNQRDSLVQHFDKHVGIQVGRRIFDNMLALVTLAHGSGTEFTSSSVLLRLLRGSAVRARTGNGPSKPMRLFAVCIANRKNAHG